MEEYVMSFNEIVKIIQEKCNNYNVCAHKLFIILSNHEDECFKTWNYNDRLYFFSKNNYITFFLSQYGLFAINYLNVDSKEYFKFILDGLIDKCHKKDIDMIKELVYNRDRRLFFNNMYPLSDAMG